MKKIIVKNYENDSFLQNLDSGKGLYNKNIDVLGQNKGFRPVNFDDNSSANEEIDLYDDLVLSYAKLKPDFLYEFNDSGDCSLKIIHPLLQDKMELLIEICAAEGIDIRITETVRNVATQDYYYSNGKSKVKGGDYGSYHQWGLAFDVCINGDEPYDIALLTRVGEIGKSLGLEWGGDWGWDMPHFQLSSGGYNINSLKERYDNPAEFADNWSFSSEDVNQLEEEYGDSRNFVETWVWDERSIN